MNTIGIDVSMDTFHAAFDDTHVSQFDNTKTGIRHFIRILKETSPSVTTIGLEATGAYHALLSCLLTEAGFTVMIINPLVASQMGTSLRKLKTDKHDALSIRRITEQGAGYPFTDTPDILALKALLSEREGLRRMLVATKGRTHANRIRSLSLKGRTHSSFETIQKTLKAEMKKIEKKMILYATETQTLLRSIPGIGSFTAVSLIAHVGDIHRFSSPEKLVAYIGLDCRVHQSGSSIHGKGYISKRGSNYLRYVLFNAAFIARRRNPDLKQYFEKKRAEGKHYTSALCAVERKLVHLIWAVWTRGTPFENR